MNLARRIALSLNRDTQRIWYIADDFTHGDASMISVGLNNTAETESGAAVPWLEADKTFRGSAPEFAAFVRKTYPKVQTIYLDGVSFRQAPDLVAELKGLLTQYNVELD